MINGTMVYISSTINKLVVKLMLLKLEIQIYITY